MITWYPESSGRGEEVCFNNSNLEGVGEVVEVDLAGSDGALAGDEASVEDTRDSKHGKAAVLELSKLVALKGLGVLAKAKGVEPEGTGLAAVREHGLARHLEVVGSVLNHAAEEEDLPEATSGHLEEGLSSHRVGGGREGKADELLHDSAEGGKHGNAAVLELRLAQPVQRVLSREAEGVEANIANHGAVEGSRAGKEGNRGRLLLHLHACTNTKQHRKSFVVQILLNHTSEYAD